jgi:hypothetical protein
MLVRSILLAGTEALIFPQEEVDMKKHHASCARGFRPCPAGFI